MKKAKKLGASVLAISLAAVSLSGVTANGICLPDWDANSEGYQEFLKRYVEFDCEGLKNLVDPYSAARYVNMTAYYNPDGDSSYAVLCEKPSKIRILLPKGSIPAIEVQSIVNEIAPDYTVVCGSTSRDWNTENGGKGAIYEVSCLDVRDAAFEQSQLIYEALSDRTEVLRFEFSDGIKNPIPFYGDVTEYTYDPEEKGDIGAMLTEFVEENALNFTVIVEDNDDGSKDTMRCDLVPGESVTREEEWSVADQIREKFNIGAYLWTPTGDIDEFDGVTIEMAANLNGDANNDGELDIADATLILQYIGNSDKYKLTAQGAYNADADGSGDVTALDALEVQRIDAKMR